MTRDIAAIEADIAYAQEQMKPWQDIMRDLVRELDAARDALAASATIDEVDLGRLSSNSPSAIRRVERVMSEMHPAMRMLCHWLPVADNYSHGYFPAPNLTLKYRADADYVEALAVALVEFATRFMPPLPEDASHGDMVFADILDHNCGEGGVSYVLYYEPTPGGQAKLLNAYRAYSEPVAEGTLVEVLAKACEVAWYEDGPQRSSWDDDEDRW